jgi:type II secretory ATPase GspE/PulE/Tfp pilus assembly ATPase PilB-like protein
LANGQPATAAGASPGVEPKAMPTLDDREVVSQAKETQSRKTKPLSGLTPSVNDQENDHQAVAAETHEDDLDVDMFARGNVGRIVDELKIKKAEEGRRNLAKQAKLPFVRLLGYPISPEVLAIVPPELVKSGIIAYLRAGNKVRLGITDPTNVEINQGIEALKRNTPYDFIIAVIGDDSYRYAAKLYEDLPHAIRDADSVSVSEGGKRTFEQDIKNLSDLKSKIGTVPTTKLIDLLLTGAVKVGASDVHVEPAEDSVRIRYRLDGVLHDVVELPNTVTNSILSRLKFLAKLKLDVNRLPQDGRFTVTENGTGADGAGKKEIDIRVATIPAEFGEAITMRLLDRDTLGVQIDSLGLTGHPLEQVMHALERPQGLVLECGPTGSGKTTTLYSFLDRLNEPGKKVITLEDPVEYRLPGIIQSQVQPEHDYDFSNGFRAILRLDPDIVMVGEIRDNETAEYATQASLTGHIVLSTLHTNDAPTAIPRLIDLGVRPFLLSNAINVIIAQRLVRQVCSHCAEETKPDQAAITEVKQRLAEIPAVAKDAVPPESQWLFLKGKGCDVCNGTGYKGRIGIFEVLVPNEELEQLAINQAPVSQLRQAAARSGMMTMEQDGLIKALTGVTTLDEVWRVARDI